MGIDTVMFDKEIWDIDSSLNWLLNAKIIPIKYINSKYFHVYQINNHEVINKYSIKRMPNGIRFIMSSLYK